MAVPVGAMHASPVAGEEVLCFRAGALREAPGDCVPHGVGAMGQGRCLRWPEGFDGWIWGYSRGSRQWPGRSRTTPTSESLPCSHGQPRAAAVTFIGNRVVLERPLHSDHSTPTGHVQPAPTPETNPPQHTGGPVIRGLESMCSYEPHVVSCHPGGDNEKAIGSPGLQDSR